MMWQIACCFLLLLILAFCLFLVGLRRVPHGLILLNTAHEKYVDSHLSKFNISNCMIHSTNMYMYKVPVNSCRSLLIHEKFLNSMSSKHEGLSACF